MPWIWPWARPNGEELRRRARTERNEAVVSRLSALSDELRSSVDRLEALAERLETSGGGSDAD